MFSPLFRIIVILCSLGGAGYQFYLGSQSWMFYLAAAVLLSYYHFRFGSVLIAYNAFRRQDFATMRKLIGATSKPQWLSPANRACYYFLKGILATIDENFQEAKQFYLQAVDGGLKADHMKCLTYCILADTSLRLAESQEAERFLAKAKEFPEQDDIKPMIAELESKLAEDNASAKPGGTGPSTIKSAL